jgi:oligopeptide transport system ATP-binding protein
MAAEKILEAKHLKKFFPIRKGLLLRHVGDVKAVDDISFSVQKGESLGLVGESGCGKSTLGRTLLRLYEPTSGEIIYKGKSINNLAGKELKTIRKNLQMIFQDPYESLNPRMTAANIVRESFRIHGIGNGKDQMEKVETLFEQVDLKKSQMNRYPHEFSGGQRQRISIARAIALCPDLLISDESVSALDVSVQAQIINLLKDLQKKLSMTYIFISHDLSVVEHFCDRIIVMYLGKIVEIADKDSLFNRPLHPYTNALINAVPIPGKGKRIYKKILHGDVPNPINPPSGCYFHPRCTQKKDQCSKKAPSLRSRNNNGNHRVSCWLYA